MSYKYTINGFCIAILLSLLCLLFGCEKKQKEAPKAVAVSLDGSMEVGLMTFNLRYENSHETGKRAWRNRVVGIVEMLQREKIEILGIQEGQHGQVADLWASLPNFGFEGVGRDDGDKRGEYSGIFYCKDRFEADPKNQGTIWLSDTPNKPGSKTWGNTFPRMATWVRLLDRSSGQALWVMNTHFDHMNQESRDKGVRLMVRKLGEMNRAGEPVVVMGDFNATEGNTAVRYLAENHPNDGFQGLKETFDVLNAKEKKRGTLHFWMADVNRQWKVDHIFVSKQAKVLEAKIVKSGEPYLSDHFPVKARVRFLKE
jgi:endonuclease/exonuclease/phosphatase family metal-dependent hydrolase